jgi:hypothetical protein
VKQRVLQMVYAPEVETGIIIIIIIIINFATESMTSPLNAKKIPQRLSLISSVR